MKNTKLFRVFVLMLALAACVCMLFAGCTETDEPDNSDTSSSQDGSTDTSVPDSGTGDSTDPGTGDSTIPSTGDSTIPSTGDSTGSGEKPDVPCSHMGGTATCTAQAVCENCGQAYGELAEHTMVAEETVAPTCETAGYTVYGCENCDATEERDQVEALGGECDWYFVGYSEEDRPMCGVKGGTELYVCGNCEATKEVAQEAMHDFSCKMNVVEGKEPTCTEAGYAWYECMSCSEGVERKIPAEHTYDSPTDVTNATCTTDGSLTWICTVCEDVYVETVPANGHNQKWEYDETTATCTEAGVEKYGCWNCDEIIEVEVEAYGHEWSVDESTLDLEMHAITRTCGICDATEQVSSYGMEADPIPMTVPGTFTVSATGEWTYYSFKQTAEGYLTFTFDTGDVNVNVKDANYAYDSQFFWGGETTFVAEIFADGTYVVAISTNSGDAIDISVTTEYEEADVPVAGEVADKAIVIEWMDTAYTVNGKLWYKFDTPISGTLTVEMLEGEATSIKYGVSADELAEYKDGFDVEENVTYYFLIESDADATFVINVEAEKGSMDNPYELVVGENTVEANVWYFLTVNAAGTYTFTVDPATATFAYGEHPYMVSMYGGESTYTVDANPMMMYYGGYFFQFNETLTITVSFKGASAEPDEPNDEIGELVDSLTVITTDTYTYDIDNYTFLATESGTYTFFVPAGLGLWSDSAIQNNPYGTPEVDYYGNATGAYVTVELGVDEEYKFWFAATTKDTWTIDVYFAAPAEDEIEYIDEFNGLFVDDNSNPSLGFAFADGILVVEDVTGFFNISGEYTYGYNAELGEFLLSTDAFTLNVSSGTLFLNGRVPLVEYVEPTFTEAVVGENSVNLVCENYRYNEVRFVFEATEAGTYVFDAAEGEENFVLIVEGEYGAEMVDVPFEVTLDAGEVYYFIVSTGANVMTTTEDTVEFVITFKSVVDDSQTNIIG